MHTIPFANVDLLLGQHPGVAPAAEQQQLITRRRGGYCFENSQIFAAALEGLGYRVRRRLGRVHQSTSTRTHLVVTAAVDDR
ncbi:arylamine N-acetyltransferase [Antrihabitans cavernicola]|uniref:Arylamine N-acetyltransferase n=1 Tax=Antrihabitans cavernicola TaxID=2495913 RepID=A0A5A7S1Y5_9NOCA|nr:arylamine N-acetyltransferase [Spelaeibacter cavernicola]